MIRILFLLLFASVGAQAATGVVVLHGKGGRPNGHAEPLAKFLEMKGLKVVNDEMPWSKERQYDKDLAVAAEELQRALGELVALVGQDPREEVLDRVFARFCIGK